MTVVTPPSGGHRVQGKLPSSWVTNISLLFTKAWEEAFYGLMIKDVADYWVICWHFNYDKIP